jgi:anti-sigma factor RsiW
MTCRDVADFLADYVSGALDEDVRARFERHLSLCPNCQAYLATYRATIALGRGAFDAGDADARTAFPESLVTTILETLRT